MTGRAIHTRVHRLLHGHWPQRINDNGKDYACAICSKDEREARWASQRQMETENQAWNRKSSQKARELEADE